MEKYSRHQVNPYINSDQEWSRKLVREGEGISSENESDYHRDFYVNPKFNSTPRARRIVRHDDIKDEDIGNYGRGGYYGNTYDQEAYNQDIKRSQENIKDNFRGKGPRSYQRSDNRIFEDVNDRLSDDPYIDATDIEVTVNNGTVMLKGTIESIDLKWRAEDIAETVSGVKNVENLLRTNKAGRIIGPARSKETEALM
jgi:hypothetical protein